MEELKEFEVKTDEFKNTLDEESKIGYDFINKAYFLDKDSHNNLLDNLKKDYELDNNLFKKSEIELMNKYQDLFVDELRNYSVGIPYKRLKEVTDDRLKLAKYINLMNEYEFTYEEELDFNLYIVNLFKENKITLEEPLEDLMTYLEENYE